MALALTGGLTLAPAQLPLAPLTAHAADTDVVNIPDANLKARLNSRLGSGRTATQDITVGEAASLTSTYSLTGPFADLTGLEALTNAQGITIAGASTRQASTFTSLAPLAGLTNLTELTLQSGKARNLRPLAGLTSLTTLLVQGNGVTNPAPLATLTNLTSLSLPNNAISDASRLPQLPNLTTLNVTRNRIVNPAPIVGKVDPAKIATLDLTNNRIADVSSLAMLGSSRLVDWANPDEGLLLNRNRITDFTPLDSWSRPPASYQTDGQQLYVGAYTPGGVVLPALRQSAAIVDPLRVEPATAGSYDPATRRVTLTDESATSVELMSTAPDLPGLQTRWTVNFSDPPVDPVDGTPPTVTGTSEVWSTLEVTAPGTVGAEPDEPACAPESLRYQWLRDGAEIVANPHTRYLDSNFPYDGGNLPTEPTYTVWPRDLGHRLSVRVSCADTGGQGTSAPTPVVTNGEAEKPVIGTPDGGQARDGASSTASTLVFGRSGVALDPDGTRVPFHVAQLGADGQLIDPSQLRLSVTAENAENDPNRDPATVLGPDDIELGGSDANRWIVLRPKKETGEPSSVGVGVTPPLRVTVTVTGPSGKTEQVSFLYEVSRATTPTSRVLVGTSDASTAIAVGDGHLLIADDERASIRLQDARVSGRELATFSPGPSDHEIDFESAARKGDAIFWLGSHGNKKDGEYQESRHRIYQTRLTGSGANARIAPVGTPYQDLRTDLAEWDLTEHHGELGLAAAGNGKIPADRLNGFNIEGAEFSPDGSALYLGFRSPVVPPESGGRALIVPLENVEELTNGTATKAEFGDPILLDLDGHSIREIRKNAAGEYLILSATAGPPPAATGQALWSWDGDPQLAPVRLTTQVLPDSEPEHADNAGAWEGIGELPARLAPGQSVRLIMDQGYVELYGTGIENKDDENDWRRKSRTDLVELSGAVGTLAAASAASIAFPEQAAQTTGASRIVTVTNSGSGKLRIGRVAAADDDGESADDFLVSRNECSDEVLLPGDSCKVGVRFSPARENAASHATLVVKTNTASGRLSVSLSGTSTALPTGPSGEDGARGDRGDAGAGGRDGADGPVGPAGPLGPLGPLGPVGPKGDAGAPGRDGTFSLSAAGSAATRVRRGRTATVSLRVSNGTAAAFAGSTLTASAPKALKARVRAVKLGRLRAGESRTIRLRLTVGRTARVGTHVVTVRMRVGGETVTQRVQLRVTR
ncbi:DUF3616 domain-containing protein [Conexibacter stalactiti]|uniref:DUF3616 domain-containing protein n=1 Tax=Conexibacter stalactiti TaxID=1940611 RepID=A0ABU4HKC7_9ACTN|nr:DUF3616 domain-containing protein [Conexibacter stalactiti]MDW5593700.1 DUF3616 domain-containing protein [Conexibacter stalactiti]MEC5034341.1 DUF3616 domain-containing protein [Conexibacter stalactiti]